MISSVNNIKWKQKSCDIRLAKTIFQKFNFSEYFSKIIASKDISLDSIENFLNPKLKNIIPNPFELLDMSLGVNHVIKMIKKDKKICIFADYDVDGATSSALLKRFFAMIGKNVDIYIPDRIEEGYGPNSNALLKLKKQNSVDLVITLDCGTVAFEPLKIANEAGLEIIVIDHHIGSLEKPEAIAVINPNRIDENFKYKNLAAVGVTFLFCIAINKKLREIGFFKNKSEPDLLSLLDLVALGTICDVVPLDILNRSLVINGIKVIQYKNNLGIKNLCEIANLNEEINSWHLGFILGPRINAGGRVGKSDLGSKLLSSSNEIETTKIAEELDQYNNYRKEIESLYLEECFSQIENQNLDDRPLILVKSKNFHQGVIGILASRIKDKYNKPTIVISLSSGIGKASCRSIICVNLGNIVLKAKSKELILEGGGHSMAAGFSVSEEKISDLYDFLCTQVEKDVENYLKNNIQYFSDILTLENVNVRFADELKLLEPYGSLNEEPLFLIKDIFIKKPELIGKNRSHIRCFLSNENLAKKTINSIIFNCNENLSKILLSKNHGEPISIIGKILVNNWLGKKRIQILIKDLIKSN